MNIYEVQKLESKIERIARENDGEIPEELLKELVETQTKSLEKIEDLVKYIRSLELVIEQCKLEEKRIEEIRYKAGRRIESIKKYLTPFVKSEGHVDAGTFRLSNRKSSVVKTRDNFSHSDYMKQKIEYNPDKKKIKKALDGGEKIDGAWLEYNDNLQIK